MLPDVEACLHDKRACIDDPPLQSSPKCSVSRGMNNPYLLQIYEEVSEGAEELDLGGSKVNMRAYCTWFNFKGADQQKKLSVLSGGERNRLQLAKV